MSEITVVQFGELIAQAKAGRVTRENLQKFILNPDSCTGYTVSVDYGKTVEEMVSSGRYDQKNDNITSKNFPVNGNGVVTLNLELVHLSRVVNSDGVLSYMEANGLRPTNLAELLAFGATYPEVQREFPVVCLDKETSSWVHPCGRRNVPYLSRDGSDRMLNLDWFGNDWSAHCRFLAVRK